MTPMAWVFCGPAEVLPSRSRSTPLEVKLNAYLQSMEQTEGKDVRDGR